MTTYTNTTRPGSHNSTGSPEWDATLFLLRSPLLVARTDMYIDDVRRSINWDGLQSEARSWSSGERLLVDAAHSLWNDGTLVNLRHVFATLDSGNLNRFLQALAIRGS